MASAPAAEPVALPPLIGWPWLLHLSAGAANQDVVTLPLGAKERRPVVVAVHGASDRPDWACGGWRIGVEAYSFVVCPTGVPMGNARFGWRSRRDIAVAVDRAIVEVHRRFPDHARSAPMIYAGFSQGASLAGPYLIENAHRFPVVALAEGGYNYLIDAEFSRKFRTAGGKRVLLLCGTASCLGTAKRAQIVMERAGLHAIVTGDPTSGHNLNGPMQDALRREWHRLVAGVPGWESFPAHRWPR